MLDFAVPAPPLYSPGCFILAASGAHLNFQVSINRESISRRRAVEVDMLPDAIGALPDACLFRATAHWRTLAVHDLRQPVVADDRDVAHHADVGIADRVLRLDLSAGQLEV